VRVNLSPPSTENRDSMDATRHETLQCVIQI
jgi:hypothetical protein